ncbi:MAG: HAD hydrolase-like protein, partial [Cellvibrionaceae bacterium]|nr:HAD hydrolase-like protein [Cellvibrionaceae bacterium]
IGCAPHEAIYIGDHQRDIDCGRAAGMPTIAAAYGYVPEGQCASDWQADHIVQCASEIWPLLNQHYLD